MIKLFKNGMQRLNGAFAHYRTQYQPQYRQAGVSTEDEELAMSCGAFNPRFLAKIKRTKTDSNDVPEQESDRK